MAGREQLGRAGRRAWYGLEGVGSPQSVSGGGRPCSGCGFWAGLESLTLGGLELSEGLPPRVPGSGWWTHLSLAQWPCVCCLSFLTCKVGASAVLTSEGHVRVSRVGGAASQRSE